MTETVTGGVCKKIGKIFTWFIRESVRLIAHEVGMPKVECNEKELGKLSTQQS